MLIAFVAGIFGALIGGTQVFVLYGLAGIVSVILQYSGVTLAGYNDIWMNIFLLPAVIFNGNVFATAYAGTKYEIDGADINKSLEFTKDPFVLLFGGIGGLAGYLMFTQLVAWNVPFDAGACTVLTIEIFIRLIFQRGRQAHTENFGKLMRSGVKFWLYELCVSLALSYFAGVLVQATNQLSLPFYLSAASLLWGFVDPHFPATHHITMVAAYAMFYSGNILFALLFGVIAQLFFLVFSAVFNTSFKSHIDPPAFAIFTCSFVIFALFK